MDDSAIKIISERLDRLPNKLRNYIASGEFELKVKNLSRKHIISEESLLSLENEILLVMIDLEDPASLAGNIEKNTAISKEKISAIVGDIEREVFGPVLNELKEKNVGFQTRETEVSAGESGAQAEAGGAEKDTRKDMLRELEEHANSPEDLIKQKLESETRAPMKETVVKAPEPGAYRKEEKGSYKVDPYRETIE